MGPSKVVSSGENRKRKRRHHVDQSSHGKNREKRSRYNSEVSFARGRHSRSASSYSDASQGDYRNRTSPSPSPDDCFREYRHRSRERRRDDRYYSRRQRSPIHYYKPDRCPRERTGSRAGRSDRYLREATDQYDHKSDRYPRETTEYSDRGSDLSSGQYDASIHSSEVLDDPWVPLEHDSQKDGDVQLSNSTLKNLGEPQAREDLVKVKIRNKIISLWSQIIQKGSSKDDLESILKKYPLPENFEAIHVPKLNPEVKLLMSDSGLRKESFQTVAQEKIGMAIYAVGAALTTLFNSGGKKDDNIESYLSDAGRI